MNKVLKPSKLDLNPNRPDAQRAWEHWHFTLKNYLARIGENAASETLKHSMLTNFVPSVVFSYFSTASTFDDAIRIFDGMYKKPKMKPLAVISCGLVVNKKGKEFSNILTPWRHDTS